MEHVSVDSALSSAMIGAGSSRTGAGLGAAFFRAVGLGLRASVRSGFAGAAEGRLAAALLRFAGGAGLPGLAAPRGFAACRGLAARAGFAVRRGFGARSGFAG